MTPDRWNKLRALYDVALDHAPNLRLSALSSQAGDDPELIIEVLQMIEQHNAAGSFLESSPAKDLRDQLFQGGPLFQPDDRVAQRFKIIRLIGTGGMGEVYEAEDIDLGQRIALKTVRIDRLRDAKAHQRLRREALLARKVTHPNICRIYDVLRHQIGETEVAVLSMELLEGQTLAQILKVKGQLSPAEAEPIIRQILAALGAAHQSGIVHRDLKPSNVILVDSRAVVTDFGLAIAGPDSFGKLEPSTTLTLPGQLMGTPEYMAPEQIRNQTVTARSDIYALGMVMYEMLTGQRPSPGANGIEEVLNRVLEAPPSPRTVNPKLSRRWESVILRCLEREPERRFASAEAVLVGIDSGAMPWQVPTISRRAWLTGGGSLAAVGIGWRYIGQNQLLGTKLVLTKVDNRTEDHELDSIGSLLEHQIIQSSRVQLLSQDRVAQFPEQMGLLKNAKLNASQFREMALRDGAAGVIFVSISTVGSDYELHLRLEGVNSSPLRASRSWSKDFPAQSKRDLFTKVDDAARWIRQQTGESLNEISKFDRPAEDTTTNSWEAWRLYGEAKTLAANDDLIGAIALLTEATRLDTKFAMAWRNLADYQIRRHNYRAGYANWDQAIAALDARHNTTIESYRIRGMYFEDTGRYPNAEHVYRTLSALLQDDYQAQFYLASVIGRQNRRNEALVMFQALLAKNPGKSEINTHLIPIYLLQGRFDWAHAAAAALRKANMLEWADYGEYAIAMANGDWKSAAKFARSLAGSLAKSWQVRGPLVLASYSGYMGALTEARSALALALKNAHQEGSADWQARIPVWDLYLQSKEKLADTSALRERLVALQQSNWTPELVADYSFAAHLVGLQVKNSENVWPDLPSFSVPTAQLYFLQRPTLENLEKVLDAARNAPYYRHRDALEFAGVLCRHHRWPDATITQALSKGLPSCWWGNELSMPGRVNINRG